MKESDFIGLTKKGAQNLAEARNLIFRLIRIDETNFFPYPEEKFNERVCVEIENGKVTKASFQ